MSDTHESLAAYRTVYGSKYPPGWEQFERNLKKERGERCEYCGIKEAPPDLILQAHHIHPIHTPEGEARALDPTNVIILCPFDHLHEGHVGDYLDWDLSIDDRAKATLAAINDARAATGTTDNGKAPL